MFVESESTGTLKSSEKKFSKLGHRVTSKTPLQLYHESIKHSTKKMNSCEYLFNMVFIWSQPNPKSVVSRSLLHQNVSDNLTAHIV